MQLCMDLPLDAFYIPASRILFDLIRDFIENGSPLDFEYVKEALINDGQLEEIGGVQYLSEIYAFVPCGAGLSSYLKIVKEKYAARQFILFCDKGKVAATDRDVEIGPLLAEAQKTIVEIVHGNNGNSAKPYLEFLKPSEVKSYQPPPGTLLIGNNHVVRGGVSVVGGPPGVGRSARNRRPRRSWSNWTRLDRVSGILQFPHPDHSEREWTVPAEPRIRRSGRKTARSVPSHNPSSRLMAYGSTIAISETC